MLLYGPIRMYGGFEKRVMSVLRILKVFVSCGSCLAVRIFNLLDNVLSPWKTLKNLKRLKPLPLF
jgi:hypothetical protein